LTVDELAAIPLFSSLAPKELRGRRGFLAVVVEGKAELTKLVNGVEQVIGVRLPGELGGEIPMTLGSRCPRACGPSSRHAS